MAKNIKNYDPHQYLVSLETNIDNDVTVIKTRYVVNGNEGTIAIVGPKRMDYEKVVSMLDFIKKEIEKKRRN